nr:metallophosphoesterase [uncultured Desulfobulbus sp.]
MNMDRRELLKIGGASAAGIALSGLDLPWLRLNPAMADALSDDAWCFGVMADTQWKRSDDENEEKSTCALRIIDALNKQFIQHGCKYVIQVGDLVNDEEKDGARTLHYRADACQALYDAGVGFYPVRGNHEDSAQAAVEVPDLFPQMLGQGDNLAGATNFSYPFKALEGLSYSFDVENVRCVFIDQFVRPDGSNYNGEARYDNNLLDQLDWVEETLKSTSSDQHTFVFAHKNLIGQNHKDVISGGDLTANPTHRDRFIKMMDVNGVGYYMGGHDHVHHRSIVTDAAQEYNVDQIICSSNSYKFYTPRTGDDGREFPVCQELYTIGFYIVTVDGPRVTVDFYSASHGQDYGSQRLETLPSELTFYLRERFGYSLNGGHFAVERNESYTSVTSTFEGYAAKILRGTNKNSETDILGRKLCKTVNTGWAESSSVSMAGSPILTLWGLVDNLSLYDEELSGKLPSSNEPTVTDTYALSLSYNRRKFRPSHLVTGRVAIASRNEEKQWVNAVELNSGGTSQFVYGPWKESYGLGTYGIDPKTGTAWAVLNQESDFVVKYI